MQKKITHFHKSKIKKKDPRKGIHLATRSLKKFSEQLYQLFYVLGGHKQKNDRKGNVH